MTKQDFLEQIIVKLDLEDEDITLDTNLKAIDDYDSFAILSIVAFVHKNFKLQLQAAEVQDLSTLNELIKLIGEDKFN